MKKILAITAIIMMGMTTLPNAQAQVNVNINIGSQPGWGPVGYDYARYYYFPAQEFYYDVHTGQYIIFVNNRWVHMRQVPGHYRFNPYNAYKVVINQHQPYLNHVAHRRAYGQYRNYTASRHMMIRDSRDHRYFASKDHPRHKEFKRGQHNSRNKHMEPRRGHDRKPVAQHGGKVNHGGRR